MLTASEFVEPNLFGYIVLILFIATGSQLFSAFKPFSIRSDRKLYQDMYRHSLEKIAKKFQLTIADNEEAIIDKLIANSIRYSLYSGLSSIWPFVYFLAIPSKLGSITVLFLIEVVSSFLLLTQSYEKMRREKQIIFEGLKT